MRIVGKAGCDVRRLLDASNATRGDAVTPFTPVGTALEDLCAARLAAARLAH